MRKLDTEKRAAILNALVEGASVNSTARICNVSKITVLRLLADAGTICAQYHDQHVRNLKSERVQCDEAWSFILMKDKNVPAERRGQLGFGDAWLWCALDTDSKLIINWLVGDRSMRSSKPFMQDLASRLTRPITLTTDSHTAYPSAVREAFGKDVRYAQLHKIYEQAREGVIRYSPPVVVGCAVKVVTGAPNRDDISTSHVERQNLSLRMGMRRFTRLTNAHSKKLENHKHAVALHYFHYNFIRKHSTIKTTPAVAAGVASRELTMLDLVEMIRAAEGTNGSRITNYLPAFSNVTD